LKTVVQANHPNPSNNTNSYGYDHGGNVISLSDENGHTTRNAFDLLYQPVSKTLPDATLTESRQYDTAGNLASLTHFNGKTTSYTYDALNRLLSKTPDPSTGEPTVSFTYTATGKYASSTAADGTTTYSYDNLDRLSSKATPEGTLNYTYDAAGHVASIASSNSNGASVSYTYDDLNRLSTVVDRHLGTTTYAYDPASNVTTATYPNGFQSIFTYDSLNRLTAMASQVSGYAYQLGPTGNRTSVLEYSGRTINWSYDGINRPTNETISSDPAKKNGAVTYGLDPVGNRLTETSSLSGVNSGSYSYNADDELSTETYDANGNTLTTGGKSFTYDSENHLTSMTAPGSVVRIFYDAFGNRVAKTVNGITTRYLVEDDVNPTGYPQVLEETVNGVVERVYTYGLQRIGQYQFVTSTWTPSFYGYDGAGSVRQLTNAVGAVTDTYDYDAFGNKVGSTGTTPNNYLYRGEQYDPDLGLYYLRARYYNPTTGRLMSRDPYDGNKIIPISLHKYLYAGSNPVNYVDPRGREAMFEYAIRTSAAIPEAKLISIYGCVADAALAAVDLILDPTITASSALGGASTVVGCVLLTPGLSELAEEGNVIVKSAEFAANAAGWGACALDAEDFINGLNGLLSGSPNGDEISKSIENLGGCVGDLLGKMLKAE
jgi:RHS repeat-associated protein